jgi:hypothetical protein
MQTLSRMAASCFIFTWAFLGHMFTQRPIAISQALAASVLKAWLMRRWRLRTPPVGADGAM